MQSSRDYYYLCQLGYKLECSDNEKERGWVELWYAILKCETLLVHKQNKRSGPSLFHFKENVGASHE